MFESKQTPDGAISPILDRLNLIAIEPPLYATEGMTSSGVTGITSQFREEAGTYDKRYFDPGSKRIVIEKALSAVGRTVRANGVMLDIGCGSGNATFALLELFGEATIYSTDLSPELLAILSERAKRLQVETRIKTVLANASEINLAENALDLVVASSMLHHLMDPPSFLRKVTKSLRRDGVAIFLEPFAAGYIVLRQLLQTFVRLNPTFNGFSEDHIDFFRRFIFTIGVMAKKEWSEGLRESLDDKWLFTRDVFSSVARANDLDMEIFSTNPPSTLFRTKIDSIIYSGLGVHIELPSWAEEIVRECDESMNNALCEELLMEACIVYAPR